MITRIRKRLRTIFYRARYERELDLELQFHVDMLTAQHLRSGLSPALARRAAIVEGFPRLEAKGWALRGCGAYFAYVTHPFAAPSDEVARRLVAAAGVLLLPGTMFGPGDDPAGARGLRIAYANVDRDGIAALFDRLGAAAL